MRVTPEVIKIICSGCRCRYAVPVDWLGSAIEFDCSCGARLKPNTESLFQVRLGMAAAGRPAQGSTGAAPGPGQS